MSHVRVPSAAIRVPDPGPGPLAIVGRAIEAHGEKLAQQSENLQVAKFGADLLEIDTDARVEARGSDPQTSEQVYASKLDAFEKTLGNLSPDAQARAAVLFERRRSLGEIAVRLDARQRTNELLIVESNRLLTSAAERVAVGTVAEQQIASMEIEETLDGLVKSGAITRAERLTRKIQIEQRIRKRQREEANVALDKFLEQSTDQFSSASSNEERSAISDSFNKVVDEAKKAGDVDSRRAFQLKQQFKASGNRKVDSVGDSIRRRMRNEFQAGNAEEIQLLNTEAAKLPAGAQKTEVQELAKTLLQRLNVAETGADLLMRWYGGEDIDERLLPRDDQSLLAFSRALQRMNEDIPGAMAKMAEAGLPLPQDFERDLQRNLSVRTLNLDLAVQKLQGMEEVDRSRVDRLLASLDNGDLGRVALEAVRDLEGEEREEVLKMLSTQTAIAGLSKQPDLASGNIRAPSSVDSPIAKAQTVFELKIAFDLSADQPISDQMMSDFSNAYRLEYIGLLSTPLFAQADGETLDKLAGARAMRRIGNRFTTVRSPSQGSMVVPSDLFPVGSMSSPDPELASRFNRSLGVLERNHDGVARPDLGFFLNARRLVPIISRDPDLSPEESVIGFGEWLPDSNRMGNITRTNEPKFFKQAVDRSVSPGSQHPNLEVGLRKQPDEPATVEALDARDHIGDPGGSRGGGIVRLVKSEWIRIYGRLPRGDTVLADGLTEMDLFREMLDEKAVELGFDSFSGNPEPEP